MSKEYLTKALFNSIDKLTFDNIEEENNEPKIYSSVETGRNRGSKITIDNLTTEEQIELNDVIVPIVEGHLTNEQLNTIEAEQCAKDDIKTNCECKNNDDIVILVDTRFEKRCIRISIRS